MAITIIQITIIIVFFIYLIVNIVKLSKANREYNKSHTGEIEKENRPIAKKGLFTIQANSFRS